MKLKLTLIAAAMAFSGMAMAAGEYGGTGDTGAGQMEGGAAGADVTGQDTGAGMDQAQTGLLGSIDKDADGKVSRDELTSYFDQHDANSDGNLDQSEFAAFESGAGGTQMQQEQPVSPDTGMDQAPADTGVTPDQAPTTESPSAPDTTGQ